MSEKQNHIIAKIQTDVSEKRDFHKKSRGYRQGADDERQRLKLDDIIEKAIEKVDVATRLYPEVYTHILSDAVLTYIQKLEENENTQE